MPAAKKDEAQKRTVTRFSFEDGSTLDVDFGRLSTILAFERAAGTPYDPAFTTHNTRLAYIQAGQPNGTSDAALEEWADTITGSEVVEVEAPTGAPQKR